MNGKQIKKIRKEINKSVDEKEKEIVEVVYNRFNSYPFGKRFKMAVKLLFKKL
jgi:hypothetical protein